MGKTKSARRRAFRQQAGPLDGYPHDGRLQPTSHSSLGSGVGAHNHSNSQHHPNAQEAQNSIYTDLSSLDDTKRIRACKLLNNMLVNNVDNSKLLNALTTPEILSKLAMRLTDSSRAVQYEAVGAVRNLAVAASPEIVKKLVDCGILNIVLTLATDHLASIGATNSELCVQLVGCIANLLAADETCASALAVRGDTLVPAVLRVFQEGYSIELELAIVNLILTASDGFGDLVVSLAKHSAHDVLLTKLGRFNFHDSGVSSLQLSRALVGVKSIGSLVNMCITKGSHQEELLSRCGSVIIRELMNYTVTSSSVS
jgi:hypothetical protein